MGLLEILLLLAGAAIFIISFRLPAGKEEQVDEMKELAKEEIKELVGQQMSSVKEQIEGTVDETITYAVEKTERFMDRMSNEKIMAIHEYSDTVMEEIHKNHTEVVFLYDMMNDKYENLKTTAVEVDKTVKEAKTVQAAGNVQAAEAVQAAEPAQTKPLASSQSDEEQRKANVQPQPAALKEETKPEQENTDRDISFANIGMENNNEEILRLHREGKSRVAIAKELGLGVGEVKLVLDLFEGL